MRVRTKLLNHSLIINRPTGASVVWPASHSHELLITGPNGPFDVPEGATIHFEINGVPLAPGSTIPASRTYVAHLDDLSSAAVVPPASIVDGAAGVRSVLHFQGGGLEGKEATAEAWPFASTVWTFIRADGTEHKQMLTNHVVHDMTVADGSLVELVINDTRHRLSNADGSDSAIELQCEHADNCPSAATASPYVLNEFRDLYALAGRPELPVPSADVPGAHPFVEWRASRSASAMSEIEAPSCDAMCGSLQVDAAF
jgi:hypothetical protein